MCSSSGVVQDRTQKDSHSDRGDPNSRQFNSSIGGA